MILPPLIAAAFLVYGSYYDIKTREIPDTVWVVMGITGVGLRVVDSQWKLLLISLSAAVVLGLYAARTRQDTDGRPAGGFFADQRLDAEEALTAFTWGAARACLQEDRRGRLEPGYFADLTVFSVDPLECEPGELLEARASRTVISGEVVYPPMRR